MKNGMEQHPEVTPAVVSDGFSIDCNKTNVLIQLVQSHDKRDKDGVVKVGGQKTVIPAGQTREIKCNVRTGPLSIKQEVLFEPDEIPKWPEGLTITETVICLSKGNWSKVAIPVTNDGNYNIALTPRTILGHIQRVKSIYQVDVRPACTNEYTTDTASTGEKADSKAYSVESQKEDQRQHDTQKHEDHGILRYQLIICHQINNRK